MSFKNHYPWGDSHSFNLDWIISTVKESADSVKNIVEEVVQIFSNYPTNKDMTIKRKLDAKGDFTGTWHGYTKSFYDSRFIEMESNIDNVFSIVNTLGWSLIFWECGYFTGRGEIEIVDCGNFGAIEESIDCGLF